MTKKQEEKHETMYKPDFKAEVDEVRVVYTQKPDCNDNYGNTNQSLILSTENGNDGKFFVLETDRWAFDSIDELFRILEDFEKRVYDV